MSSHLSLYKDIENTSDYTRKMSIIVSAYLDIPSKASKAFYMEHMRRLLGTVRSQMIFFTTRDLYQELADMRGELPIIFSFVDGVNDLEAIKKYGYSFWQEMYDIDPQRYHSPELGAVWFEKKEFVKRAIGIAAANNLNTDVPFIWCDAGCVRDDRWLPIISTFGDATHKIPNDTLLLQQLNPLPPSDTMMFFEYPKDSFLAGAIMAGYKDAWKKCSDLYDKVLVSYYNSKKYTGIVDQYIWASAAVLCPDYFTMVNAFMYPTVNHWFFLLHYLS